MAFRPHKFGRYVIVDPIAVGGMAEIYRARLAGSKEGPDRVIVIKKVIANLSQNSEFIQMFEEEIKITVGLTHPNIIQIYDYGKVDEQYFMAMEYVEGKNLRQFVKRLVDMKSMFSIDMSCHIISHVCHALAYAHAYKDRLTGKPLGIVHRDISPQNVMISYDGAVKLFDFGIAKAKSANEATRAGVIKGKPSYLSPEQINGEPLDGRSDIFALGIVLWELLTAKRLFVADTDMGVLRLIQGAKIEPPSTFNPAVPQALDAIVLKSLARDKQKRYQTAEDFQRDLHKFVYSFNSSFNPADLSYYAQELFKTEIKEDRERLTKFLNMEPVADDAVPAAEEKKAPQLSTKLAEGLLSTTDFNREMLDEVLKSHASGTSGDEPSPSIEIEDNQGRAGGGKPMPPKPGAVPPAAKKTGFIAKPMNVPLPGGATKISGNLERPVPTSATKRQQSESMVIPPWSKPGGTNGGVARGTSTRALRKEIDQQSSGGFRNVGILLVVLLGLGFVAARQYGFLDGTPLAFLAPQKTEENRLPASNNSAPARNAQNSPSEAQPSASQPQQSEPAAPAVDTSNVGVIVFQAEIGNYQVTVNGTVVAVNNNQVMVPVDSTLNIEVFKPGFEVIRFQTKLARGQPAAFKLDFRRGVSGTVFFQTTPSSKLSFYRDGVKYMEVNSPIENQLMPVGKYKVVMENHLIGYRGETELEVVEGRVTRVQKVLK